MPFITADALTSVPPALRGGVVVLGNFDGVHRGHQAVITAAAEVARAANAPLVVLTFEPHPRTFFRPAEPVFRLTPAPVKARLVRALGAAGMVVLPFDAALAALDAEAFVDRVLIAGLGARHVVAGFDFHFGKGRGGTPDVLKRLCEAKGVGTLLVPAFTDEGGQVVSSSRIRADLGRGAVTEANAALGWRWFVEAPVIHGDKRGRVLGYPTANMSLPPETGLALGVHAVRVRIDGTWYAGAANFGRRVQFGGGPVLLESYVLDFSGDLYGKTVRVEFCGYLRPEAAFDSVDALVAQMGHDVDAARDTVSATLAGPRTPLQAILEE